MKGVSSIKSGPATVVLKLVFLCLASAGVFSALPLFWSLPPSILPRAAYAAGIPAINATGNLSGFVQPALLGYFGTGSVVSKDV
jgi:ACS family tartrate transporter-like MFS transporter